MFIIPAIDIKDGRCVRLVEGDARRELRYAADPVEVARAWGSAGPAWLHVIDLDGAFAGRPAQLELVAAIARAVPVPIQVGGGFRTLEHVAAALASGARRVILGTAAPTLAPAAVSRWGDQIAAAIDVREGQVMNEGWTAGSGHDPVSFAAALAAAGVRRFVYTEINRDGHLSGVDASAVKRFVDTVGVPVIAAGGVTSMADLEALAAAGVEGAVVGRALYEGRVDLSLAVRRWEQR